MEFRILAEYIYKQRGCINYTNLMNQLSYLKTVENDLKIAQFIQIEPSQDACSILKGNSNCSCEFQFPYLISKTLKIKLHFLCFNFRPETATTIT